MTIYLTARQVTWINETQVGRRGLRDRHLLESAVARAGASAFGEDAYPDIHTKAAALMQSVAGNHAFVDGNKRTAVIAVVTFYNLNGWLFAADQSDLIHLVVDVAVGHIRDITLIAEYLRKWALPLED